MTTSKHTNGNERLLPTVIDEIALQEPEAIWALYPSSAITYEDGFRQISYPELANAINGAAWWIENNIGRSSEFETLTYIGPNDLRYPIFVVAAVKTGHKLLLTSPLNDTSAHVHLLDETGCKTLITPQPGAKNILSITQSRDLNVAVPPSLEQLLEDVAEPFPYEKSWEMSRDDPLAVLHTSGSTGLPKPIVIPQSFATTFANMTQVEPPEGYINQTRYLHGKRIFSPLPHFHAVGLYFGLISAVFNRTVCISAISGVPPTGQGLAEVLKVTEVNSAFLPPPIVEDIGNCPSLLDEISSKIDTIAYTGGDLPTQIGDRVAAKMRLFTIYGTTETGHGPQIASRDRDRKDWRYIQWNQELLGLYFRHHSADLHELCIERNPQTEPYQSCFTIFPELDEFPTKDLFVPHPQKPGFWTYGERADDILVFLNGEKFNPIGVEGVLDSHPEVRSALMIGSKRYQAALLLEMRDAQYITGEERNELVENLWPTIEEINNHCPSYVKINKSHIIFTDPERPMIRTAKGTVVRRKTLSLYATEIDKLYTDAPYSVSAAAAVTALSQDEVKSLFQTPEMLKAHLERCVCRIMGWEIVSYSDDLFSLGMDSVGGMQLLRNLRPLCELSVGTIYTHPTIDLLAQAMIDINNSSADTAPGAHLDMVSGVLKSHQERISAVKHDIPPTTDNRDDSAQEQVIMLTGSTGNIGPYLLHGLLKNPQVSHIYCVNRGKDAAARQEAYSRDRKLISTFDSERVTFISGNVTQNHHFGLDARTFDRLASHVTKIIHNAWTVDFNLFLTSYSNHLTGVANLVAFANKAKLRPSITFLSSISSVQNYNGLWVPEAIISDPDVAGLTGYGQSKWIGECLGDYAARHLDIDVRVMRLGQVAGPLHTPGNWNRHEWLPSLVMSSQVLRMLPDSLPALTGESDGNGDVDWIPVDLLADVLLQLVFAERATERLDGAQVYHLANPCATTWSSLLPSVVDYLNLHSPGTDTGNEIQAVPYSTWLGALHAYALKVDLNGDVATAVEANPAIKLLEFYEWLGNGTRVPRLETGSSEKASAVLHDMEAITPEAMQKWVQGWLESRPV